MSYIAKLVPNFAARGHLFCKYFFTSKINHNTKEPKNQRYINKPIYTLKRRSQQQENPGQRKRKVKTTLRKKNNGQLVLVAVDATSGPAHIKFFVKAISSTHDEVALTKEHSVNSSCESSTHSKDDIYTGSRHLVPNSAARWRAI